jgi:hypothetical protein
VKLDNAPRGKPLSTVIVVYVDGKEAGFTELDDVADAREEELDVPLESIDTVTQNLTQRVATRLAETELYADEATAMAKTWAHAWFRDPGLRILYVLPRDLIDRELPLEVDKGWPEDPKTKMLAATEIVPKVERVFVGRAEILLPSQERALLAAVEACAHGTPEQRDAGWAELMRHGRFAAPYLERVKTLTKDRDLLAQVDRALERCRKPL